MNALSNLVSAWRVRLSDVPIGTRRKAAFCAAAFLLLLFAAHVVAHHPPHPPGGDARIVRYDNSILQVATEDGWTKAVRVLPTTQIRQGRETVDETALVAGRHLLIQDRPDADGGRVATEIRLRPNGPPPHHGLVPTAIGALALAVFLGMRARRRSA